MNRIQRIALVAIVVFTTLPGDGRLSAQDDTSSQSKHLRVLFLGNSYTARHKLSEVVKAMAEAGNPGLTFEVSTVIYGGRTLADHWRLGTANFVKLHSLTADEEQATIESLQQAVKRNSDDTHARNALKKHRELLGTLKTPHEPWDVVVLQSYRDDLQGEASLYAQYAPKFAELAKAQGARVILYVTTPTTQNAQPLTAAPDPKPIMQKTRATAALANRIDASVAPMALVALRCQTQRPELTLRFVNDAHLNQTLAYLTACTLYSALFDRSPEGLPIESITDIRFLNNDRKSKLDRDGKPITRKFSATDQADLQRIAWEGYQEFQKLRGE